MSENERSEENVELSKENASSVQPQDEKLQPLNVLKNVDDSKGELKASGKIACFETVKELAPSIRDYINNYIFLADAKAAALIGVISGLLIATHSKGPDLIGAEVVWAKWECICFLACSSLLVGIVLSLFAVWPRMPISSKSGLISWVNVSSYKQSMDYLEAMFSSNEIKLMENVYKLNYDLSRVCREKYQLLTWAFRFALVGSIGSFIIIIYYHKASLPIT